MLDALDPVVIHVYTDRVVFTLRVSAVSLDTTAPLPLFDMRQLICRFLLVLLKQRLYLFKPVKRREHPPQRRLYRMPRNHLPQLPRQVANLRDMLQSRHAFFPERADSTGQQAAYISLVRHAGQGASPRAHRPEVLDRQSLTAHRSNGGMAVDVIQKRLGSLALLAQR